ncbi:MAG: Clp protease N-terminal domain-containing protein [Patescibacteria group bacterium]
MENLRINHGPLTSLPLDPAREIRFAVVHREVESIVSASGFGASQLPLEYFTEQTQGVLIETEAAMRSKGSSTISSELILHRLLNAPNSRARLILRWMRVEPDSVVERLESTLPPVSPGGAQVYMWTARQIILLALTEACLTGIRTEPEHLLLGVLHPKLERTYAHIHLTNEMRAAGVATPLDSLREAIQRFSPALAS